MVPFVTQQTLGESPTWRYSEIGTLDIGQRSMQAFTDLVYEVFEQGRPIDLGDVH